MAINAEWTHIAKMFGMLRSPWLDEECLNLALRYGMGEDPQGNTWADEIAQFLDQARVGNDVRKDKQFRANVSLISIPFSDTVLIWVFT